MYSLYISSPLVKYVWKLKQKHNIKPTLKWYISKSVPSYSNITKSCMLCLHEKFEILTYPNQDELLNKRSELASKCRHVSKYPLSNYKANNVYIVYITIMYIIMYIYMLTYYISYIYISYIPLVYVTDNKKQNLPSTIRAITALSLLRICLFSSLKKASS